MMKSDHNRLFTYLLAICNVGIYFPFVGIILMLDKRWMRKTGSFYYARILA